MRRAVERNSLTSAPALPMLAWSAPRHSSCHTVAATSRINKFKPRTKERLLNSEIRCAQRAFNGTILDAI